MNSITAILLDVGGVLVKTRDVSRRGEWEKKLNISSGQLTKEVYEMQHGELATIGKITKEAIWENIQNKFALNEEQMHQLRVDFFAGDMLNLPFYKYIGQIRTGYTTVILSNAWLNAREVYTEKYHLDQIVDYMIISAEEGLRKPDPKIFLLALERMEKKPEETLFIDDDISNIEAAKTLGLQTILFTHTEEVIEKIRQRLSLN